MSHVLFQATGMFKCRRVNTEEIDCDTRQKRYCSPSPCSFCNKNSFLNTYCHADDLIVILLNKQTQLSLTNRATFRGQSRSPNMVPFHMSGTGMVSY